MDSKILNTLFVERINDDSEDFNRKQFHEMINTICSSSQFKIFQETMSNIKEEFFIEDSIHGISHNERVAVLAMFLAIKEGVSDDNLRIILKAAIYHDIGRKTDKENHGRASADLLLKHKDELVPDFDDFDLDIMRLLCESHNINDRTSNEIINKDLEEKYGLHSSPSLEKMVKILKDADALDRVRLPRFGKINVSYLRTESAKKILDLSKALFLEYRNVQYAFGNTSNTAVFDITNFNVIEDEENYYVFRTLNDDNISDLNNPESSVIRTKGRVAREDRGEDTKFGTDSQISIEEVYTNIRVARSGKNNNCVSFSTNANVNLDYDNREYIMYAIPKTGEANIHVAGKYMLDEINKKISQRLVNGNISKNVRDILSQIDSELTSEGIKKIVGESFDSFKVRTDEKSYRGKKDLTSKNPLISRFESKQVFSREQELEYNKIVAKLTVLETNGYLRSILSTQVNNSNLLATLGVAFSSNEIIHYGDIDKSKVVPISRRNLQLLALLQQTENISEIDKTLIDSLKKAILDSVKLGKELETYDTDSNHKESVVNLNPESVIKYFSVDENAESVIPYTKGSTSLQFIYDYAKSKRETYKLIDNFREALIKDGKMSTQIEETLDILSKSTIIPNSSIISRRNNSGVKIAESVNLDMNNSTYTKMFTDKEQNDLISLINTLSRKEIEQISNGDFSVIKNKELLTKTLIPKDYAENPNGYYVDYILDSIELEKIYKVSNVRIEKKNELRFKLENKLKEIDIQKLYKAFINAEVDYFDIPNYITNLLLENGYGEYTLDEFVELDNLEEIIKDNINNFNYTITPFSIDNYLGILDNNYVVPGSLIKLREYQQDSVERIDKIFETRNFAGVVLPTGAGKSFVAMAELLKNPKQNILYFAPQEGILNQVQKHIVKNILGKSILSVEDVDLMIDMSNEEIRTFLSTKVYNQDVNIAEEISNLRKVTDEKERISIKSKMLPRSTDKNDDIMDAIHTVFPHLDMYCYQSLNSKEYQNLVKKKKDLIVFDELHRTGANTWRPLIKGMIGSDPNVKILGVTATPNRDDDNHTDMMKYMAENYGGFSKEEIDSKEYLAQEMYLTDAMQNKYVVEPKIVSFNFTLAETEQYKFIDDILKSELKKSPDSGVAKELKQIKDEMDKIINGGRKSKKENLSEISKVLEDVISEKLRNGRFIVFLEHNSKNNNMSSEEYMKEQIDLICKYFGGVNTNINADYLLSSRKKADNLKAIQDFENLDNDQLKLLFAIDMLNEGVHVEKINGELMLRPIGEGSNILYFQQIGRVIFGIDPENPPKEDEVPIIFDVYNNYLTRDLNRTANITTPTSDLNNIRLISNWIKQHERMPDINSSKQDEARKAIILKKIQEKYEKYIDGINNDNLSPTEKKEIEKILEIAKSLNLFEAEIGERIIPPGEKELGRVNAFEIKGDVRRFLDLFKESKKVLEKAKRNVKPSDTLRIRTTMSILQVLNEYGVEISDENITKLYRKINDNNNLTQEDAKENITLAEIINSEFSESTRKRIIEDLDMDLDEMNGFKLYSEFDYARQSFSSPKKNIRDIFSVYEIEEIRKTGILKENGKFISVIDDKGFVLDKAPELFRKLNVYTGTKFGLDKYDIDGYDIDGFNRIGYDRDGNDKFGFNIKTGKNKYGFLKEGVNEITKTNLDPNGFDIEGTYWALDPNLPAKFSKRINTHKKVNEYNFNRDGIWFAENINGELQKKGYEDDRGFFAFKEVSKYQFRRDGFNIQTQSMFDKNGFDYDKIHRETKTKYNRYGFDIDEIHRETGTNINRRHFDINGFYYTYDSSSKTRKNTYKYYDNNGRDIDGWDINGIDENGVKHFTEPINERGFNQKRIHTVTQTMVDENGLDFDGIYWRETNGKFVKTESVYGKNGLTINGIDRRHFRVEDKWNVLTNSIVDENNWDFEGFYWQKNENGELINTGSKYNSQGYDVDGINKYGFNKDKKFVEKIRQDDGSIKLVESECDLHGFKFDLMHKNGTPFDDNGFDIDGNHKDTGLPVNKYGFNRDREYCIQDENGAWISTGEKYTPRGFDFQKRYHAKDSFGKRKIYVSNDSLYDEDGYDINELDKHGFNKKHMYVDIFGDEYVTNLYGFGYDGYIYVLDEKSGEYKKTERIYDNDGYNIDGLNEWGFDREGLYEHKYEYDKHGFNCHHLHRNGEEHDRHGFDYRGVHKKTLAPYDTHFFDIDGYYYRLDEESGEYVKTQSKVNDDNFDIDGYWYKEKRGILTRTNSMHNLAGRDIDGNVNVSKIKDPALLEERKRLKEEIAQKKKEEELQKQKQKEIKKQAKIKEEQRKKDEETAKLEKHKDKFDENGLCKTTNLPYDENFFDKDGIHVVTKTVVDFRGFKCTGQCIRNEGLPYDRNGFKQDGTHYQTGEKYVNGYNAYGVDENGQTKDYKERNAIVTAQKFIEANFNLKDPTARIKFIREFGAKVKAKSDAEALKSIKYNTLWACEMYPKLREILVSKVKSTQSRLRVYEMKIKDLSAESKQNEEEIKRYKNATQKLKDRINCLSIDEGEK